MLFHRVHFSFRSDNCKTVRIFQIKDLRCKYIGFLLRKIQKKNCSLRKIPIFSNKSHLVCVKKVPIFANDELAQLANLPQAEFYVVRNSIPNPKGCTNLEFGKQTMSSAKYQAEHLLSSFVFGSSTFCSAYRIVTTQSLLTHY